MEELIIAAARAVITAGIAFGAVLGVFALYTMLGVSDKARFLSEKLLK